MSDGPSLDEVIATTAAVDAFHRKLHPRTPRYVEDLPRLLDELAEAVARLRAVTHTGDAS